MTQTELSIKDVITLFENDLRTKEEVEKILDKYEKKDLIEYILQENDLDESDDFAEDEDAGNDRAEGEFGFEN